jgi:hypothetical protein
VYILLCVVCLSVDVQLARTPDKYLQIVISACHTTLAIGEKVVGTRSEMAILRTWGSQIIILGGSNADSIG